MSKPQVITVSVPYSEMVHGDIELTYELPEGMTKEEFLERLMDDDNLFWEKSVQEEWIASDSEVSDIDYRMAFIVKDN